MGIYAFEGQKLKICLTKFQLSLKNDQRPKSFKLDPKSSETLLTLEGYQPSSGRKQDAGRMVDSPSNRKWQTAPKGMVREMECNFNNYCFQYSGLGNMPGGAGPTIDAPFLLEKSKDPKTITIYTSDPIDNNLERQKIQLHGIYADKDGD